MRILVLHNKYLIPGGEDTIVKQEVELLKNNGNEVFLYQVSNEEIKGIIKLVSTIFSLHYSIRSKRKIKELIRNFKPDIVHVHNFFMVLSPSVFDACWEMKIPVILTLHNFRIINPNALLMYKGAPDEKSISHSAYWCVLHKCYKNSFFQTFLVAHMIEYHRRKKTWNEKVNRFIVLTEFASIKFAEAGIPREKISIKPNFIEMSDKKSIQILKEDYFIYAGRLSEEKGLNILLDAFSRIQEKLVIVGSGPLTGLVQEFAKKNKNITYYGFAQKEELFPLIAKAKGLFLPSLWYEGFPAIILEAFYLNTLVICSKIGALEYIIQDNETGLFCIPGNTESILKAVFYVNQNPNEIRNVTENAFNHAKAFYSSETNYKLLIEIYQQSCNSENK